MKKIVLLACLLALLLCGCVVKPPAVTTDTQPTETTNIPETTEGTTTAATAETIITRPETLVRYTAEAKDLSAIAEMETIVQRDRADVEFSITLSEAGIVLHGNCTMPEGDEHAVTKIRSAEYGGKTYSISLTDEAICALELLVTDDLIILGETQYASAWYAGYFFYDGGMCGYSQNGLQHDSKNNTLMQELASFEGQLYFSCEDGVLRYEKIYLKNLGQTVEDYLPYRFAPKATYARGGTVTVADQKLTLEEDTVTTVAQKLEPVWKHAGMNSFAEYIESIADCMVLPRYTSAMNENALAELLGEIMQKAQKGKGYPAVYEIVAEEDSEIIFRAYCDKDGNSVISKVRYHGKTYDVMISAFAGVYLDILYTPDLLIFGEHGGSGPGERFCLFYDGGMCGYDGKELLLDGVNDEVVKALRAPALDFTIEDGVLYYKKYYHPGITQAIPFILEFADRPEEIYSEKGVLTFADGKLTMTHQKTTTIEEFFAERDYARYNVTNFADLMQALQDTLAQTSDFRRYTVALNSDAVSNFLFQMQRKVENGETYPATYEIVAEEDPEIILRMHCDPDGYHSLSRVQYHGNFYNIKLNLLGGMCMEVFCLPDLLIFGEAGASVPGSKFYFIYDGGMCGYDGKELLLDGVNDEVVKALCAPSLDFTVKDGVLHYAKYYHYSIIQAAPMVLKFADKPEEIYSEEGILTFADGKLKMTVEKITTIEDFAERYYADYNVTNFADLMQAMKDSLKLN